MSEEDEAIDAIGDQTLHLKPLAKELEGKSMTFDTESLSDKLQKVGARFKVVVEDEPSNGQMYEVTEVEDVTDGLLGKRRMTLKPMKETE